MPQRGHELLLALQHHVKDIMSNAGEADLMSCIKKILFPAALESIFGAAFLRHHGSERLQKAFFAFEEGFELAASPVPHFLQPSFCKGRQALLEAFRISWTEGHFAGTVVGSLLGSVSELHGIAPNVLLALLWASLANTVPATFWAVAFLLLPQNAHYKNQILCQLRPGASEPPPMETGVKSTQPPKIRQQGSNDSVNSTLVEMACDRQSLLAGCVSEAVRLRAPGIAVRMATCDLAMPLGGHRTVNVKKGDMLAVSPYETHHDDRFFCPSPAEYSPTRAGLQGPGSSLHEVAGVGGIAGLVFGGGRYRCPGRFFAEMEIALAVLFFLSQFNLQLAGCQSTTSQAGAKVGYVKDSVHQSRRTATKPAMSIMASGDPHGLLPLPETRRQVGIRWPQAVCQVVYENISSLK